MTDNAFSALLELLISYSEPCNENLDIPRNFSYLCLISKLTAILKHIITARVVRARSGRKSTSGVTALFI